MNVQNAQFKITCALNAKEIDFHFKDQKLNVLVYSLHLMTVLMNSVYLVIFHATNAPKFLIIVQYVKEIGYLTMDQLVKINIFYK